MKFTEFRRAALSLGIISIGLAGCQKKQQVQTQRPPAPNRPREPIAQAPPQSPPTPRRPTGQPDWFPRSGKISSRWTTIVVHHSATPTGNARTFDKGHRDKGWDELGYHFVIGNGSSSGDGQVEVGSRWHTQKHGAHCKTPDNYYNDHGIGICLVGDFTRTRPTQRQLASLQRLVAFLTGQCNIPDYKVTTHGLVTRKTLCPGRNFPIAWLRRSLALSDSPGMQPQ